MSLEYQLIARMVADDLVIANQFLALGLLTRACNHLQAALIKLDQIEDLLLLPPIPHPPPLQCCY
jgi:hypothetical protein